MKKNTWAAGAVMLLAALTLTGCGTDEAAEECITHMEQTLKEAGSDRALTQDEIDACNDPDRREFLMG